MYYDGLLLSLFQSFTHTLSMTTIRKHVANYSTRGMCLSKILEFKNIILMCSINFDKSSFDRMFNFSSKRYI